MTSWAQGFYFIHIMLGFTKWEYRSLTIITKRVKCLLFKKHKFDCLDGRNGACSHLTDHSKVTVIAAASASHNPEILSLIVEEGDKINPEILDISDDDGVTPLMIAGRKGSYQIIEMLIDLGVSVALISFLYVLFYR